MRALLVFGWIMISAFSSAHAEETGEVKKIQDNSFLIEEAYNQEPGVIQHIQTFQYMKNATWGYSFVQEWPVPGRTHQLSYTIPVFHLDTDTDGKKTGIGDVMLNYRYQLIYKEKEGIALAPREDGPRRITFSEILIRTVIPCWSFFGSGRKALLPEIRRTRPCAQFLHGGSGLPISRYLPGFHPETSSPLAGISANLRIFSLLPPF